MAAIQQETPHREKESAGMDSERGRIEVVGVIHIRDQK